ncbi:MAG TPA: T9SS type A sorting domain-containing protein [Chitinophagales bacterium]|nr:T9SS type A sorting domain-containing protein [Chitinophagales bacterium]
MKRVLQLWVMLLFGGIFTVNAQPLVDIGLYGSGTDTLVVKLTPRGFFNGVASNVVFAIRWKSGCGTSLGSIIQPALTGAYLPMTQSGSPKTSGGYTYQVFGGAGLQSLSAFGTSWSNGVPVTLMKVVVSNPKGTFEIVNDNWTNIIASNANYFVSLNGLNKTGAIIQSFVSYTWNGSIAICSGDSVLLGGAYRKLPGVYYDTLQSSGGCDSIVITTLTVSPAYTSTRSVSICQGQSFFAGGDWQTTSGTYYDTLTAAGCDSIIITDLTVLPAFINTLNFVICEGDSILAGGGFQTEPGIYYDTFISHLGCDSVIATNLTVVSDFNITNNVSICSGQSYFAGGTSQTTSGIYHDTFTSAFGCDSIVTTVLTVNPNPVAAISPGTVSICLGSGVVLAASGGTSYSWSTGAITASIPVMPITTTVYSVTATNEYGCKASASRMVTVNPLPPASISPASTSICSGQSTVLSASGGILYSWSTGAGTASITVSPALTTAYSVTVTSVNGCRATAAAVVTVNALPSASIFPAAVSICSGQSATLTASGGTSFSWSTGEAIQSITVNPSSTTAYSVTVTNGGCTASATRTVTVNSLPAVSITPAVSTICSGESAMLTASGGTAYLWSTGASAASITISPQAASAYSVTATGTDGCTASATGIVNVNPLPVASVTPANASICIGSSLTLTASGGGSYSWNTGSTLPSITVSPMATTSYSVTVSSASGCSASASGTVNVSNSLAASITPANPSICVGQSIVLTASGGINYTWNTGATTASITVNPAANTTYSVTVTDGSSCSATASKTVTVNSLPSPSISPLNISICSGQSTTLTAGGGGSYSWSTGSVTSAITVSPVSTTAYSVTVTNSSGCTATLSRNVKVDPLPAAAISPASAAICAGENVTLTASGGISYSWNNMASTGAITVSPASTATYTVTVTDANGCTASASRAVTVSPAMLTNVDVTFCQGNGYFAGGAFQTTAGTYYDTLTTASGCDSIVRTIITVLPSFTVSRSVQICDGEAFFAGGGYQTSSGVYADTFIARNGCDSIVITTLSVLSAFVENISVSICAGESYYAGGAWRTSSGTYYDTLTASNGCDSVLITVLHVDPIQASAVSVSICEGQSYFAGGALRTSSGIYYDTLVSSAGCDSIVTTYLTVEPIVHYYNVISTCMGDSVLVGGGFQTESGIYYDTLVVPEECLSVIVTTLVFFPPVVTNLNVQICEGENYFAGGTNQTESGVYYDTLLSSRNCDSIVITNLIVLPVFTSSRNIFICEGQSFFAGGTLRTVSGTYYDTFTASNGCDSVLTTILTVNPVYSVTVHVSICQGQRYFAGGAFQTVSGTYSDGYLSRAGCDSTVITHLTVVPPIVHNQYLTACLGESVFAGGANQTASGVYYDTLTAAGGCDSVLITNLTFYNPAQTAVDILVHAGSGFFAGGAYQTTSGIYYDTLSTSHGCDSVVITMLSVENIASDITLNEIENTMTVRTKLDNSYADNTYGAGAVGWRVPRTLDSLITSDHLEWVFYDAAGTKKLGFRVDYFSRTAQLPSGYGSLGVSGGEGTIVIGSDSSILNTTTSIHENFNTLGYVLPSSSPPTDTNYSPNPAYPGWIYDVWYEATIDLSTFGQAGYGYHDIVAVHASPDKDDVTITAEADSLVPPPCPRSETRNVIICEGDSFFAGGDYQTSRGIYYDTLIVDGCEIRIISYLTVLQASVAEIHENICEGESLFIARAWRNTSGIYSDTLLAANGCDSIITTHLSVHPVYDDTRDVSVCQGSSYFAGGEWRTTSGIYTDSLITSNGCDSIVHTQLTVHPVVFNTVNAGICSGDSIFAGGKYRKNTGVYYDTLSSSHGCDSIVVTSLSVQQTVSHLIQATICAGDSFFAGGDFQTIAGNYYDTLTGSACDSIIITSLIVLPSKSSLVPVTICSNESYFAGGGYRNVSGLYYDTLSTSFGCDSIVVTVLNVKPAYLENQNVSICSGDSIFAGGAYQNLPGIYFDSLIAENGCDSVIVTHLTVMPVDIDTVQVGICSNGSYFAGGALRNTSGIYYDTLNASSGCDSIIVTMLTVHQAFTNTVAVSICSGESYFAGGAYRNASGTYYDTFASGGCDSVIVTVLSVQPTYIMTVNAMVCEGDSLFAGGSFRTASGTYSDTLQSRFGCDSIIRTHLHVEANIIDSIDITLCEGNGYFAGGAMQFSPGTYFDTFNAAGGCDSVVVTTLQFMQGSSESIAVQICQGESHFAGGAYQTTAGIYYDTLSMIRGCDSILITELSVFPVFLDTAEIFICNGGGIFINGVWRTSSGIYYDTLQSQKGCDSIVVIHLSVAQVYQLTQSVSICQGESYYAGGAWQTVTGIYRDTFTSSTGCDSIIVTKLNVYPRKSRYNPVTICTGQSYFAQGQLRTHTGLYYDTLTTSHGCDSIILTILNVLPPVTNSVSVSICSNEQYFAGGEYRNTSGIYYDTLVAANGCVSYLVTSLTVRQAYVSNRTVSLCSGDSIFLQNDFRYLSGLYYDTFTARTGCDSVVITNLVIKQPKSSSRIVSICSGTGFYAGGAMQTQAGTYFDTLVASNGCDSIVKTVLSIRPRKYSSQSISICQGENYFAGGMLQTSPGIYYDTLVSSIGCDSIITTQLSIHPTTTVYNSAVICSGESYFAAGAYQTTSGSFFDTIPDRNGCDSFVVTILHVLPVKYSALSVTICGNEQYYAGGQLQNTPGIYYDTLTASDGCDSIVTTTLNVLPVVTVNRSISICRGDSVFLQGTFMQEAGVYRDSFTALNGCDSVVVTTLNILEAGFNYRTVSICSGDSFFAGGNWQLTDGDYYDTLTASSGCDSIVATHLRTLNASYSTVSVSICSGESYFAGGSLRTTAGTYYDTLTATNGCDSIITTHLTILPRFSRVVPVTICANETYYAGGAYQNHEGMYYDTLTARNGCDSLVITSLTVLPVSISNNEISICEGESYFAQGALQTTAGIYYDTLASLNGCDSVIATHLTVLAASMASLDITICSGESHFAGGVLQSASGIYYDTLGASNGCDSIVVTRLTVTPEIITSVNVSICSDESYYAAGAFRNSSGVYFDTLLSAQGCDSIVITTLSVLPVKSTSVRVIICAGETHFAGGEFQSSPGIYYDTFTAENGCDSIAATLLSVLPVRVISVNKAICQGETYYAGGQNQSASGVYYDTLIAANGCDSIIITHLTVLPELAMTMNVSICDNETYYAGGAFRNRTGTYVDTLATQAGCDSIIITNLTVLKTFSQTNYVSICDGDSYFVGGNWRSQSGVYYDYLTASNGCDSTVITNLLVLPKKSSARSVAICSNDSIFLQGAYRKSPGSYRDTFTASNGCDSIVTTQLTLKPSYLAYQYITVCAGESFFAGGENQTISGTYYDSLLARNGCDSVVATVLTVLNPISPTNLSYSVCEGSGMFLAGAYRTSSGIYSDTLIAANGCDSIVNSTLIVNPLPRAHAGSDRSICSGESTTLVASGGDGYLWNTGGNTASITVSPIQTTAYTVFVSAVSGCFASDTVTVFVNQLPSVAFSGLDSSYCTSSQIVMLTGIPAGGTFSGAGITGSIFNPVSLSPGLHLVTYTFTDQHGCVGVASRQVSIHQQQQAGFTGLDSAYCIETVAHLLAGNPPDGVFSGPGISNNTFVPYYAGAGNHQIIYRHVSAEGCVSADTQQVTVFPLPQIDFIISDSVVCISDTPVLLQANPDGGIFSGIGVIDSFFHPAIAGTGNSFFITYSFTDSNGCSAKVDRRIAVKNNPVVSIMGLLPGYCLSTGNVALNGAPPGGLFSGKGVSEGMFSTQAAGGGMHVISYTYTDSFQCSSTYTTTVQVFENPEVILSGLDAEYCVDAAPVPLLGTPLGGQFSGRGVVVNVFDAGIAGAGGPYPICYRYEDVMGCHSSDTSWVKVNPLPELSFENQNFSICLNSSPVVLPILPEGGTFSGPGITDNLFNPSLSGVGAHNVIYTFTDTNTCTSSMIVTVEVELCSGISGNDGLEMLKTFPSPFSDKVYLQLALPSHSHLQLKLMDVLGQIVLTESMLLQSGLNTIALKHLGWLPSGVYYIEIRSADETAVRKIMKAR